MSDQLMFENAFIEVFILYAQLEIYKWLINNLEMS